MCCEHIAHRPSMGSWLSTLSHSYHYSIRSYCKKNSWHHYTYWVNVFFTCMSLDVATLFCMSLDVVTSFPQEENKKVWKTKKRAAYCVSTRGLLRCAAEFSSQINSSKKLLRRFWKNSSENNIRGGCTSTVYLLEEKSLEEWVHHGGDCFHHGRDLI